MTNSRVNSNILTALSPSGGFKVRLIGAVSSAVLALSVASTASAQCTPAAPNPGDTVTCASGNYTTIHYAVDDLTVVIGDLSAPTLVNSGGTDDSIRIQSNSGDITLTFVGPPSPYGGDYVTVRSGNNITHTGHGVYLYGGAGTGNILVTGEASLESFNQNGLRIRHLGTGTVDVSARNISSSNGTGLHVRSYGSGVDVDISGNLTGRYGGDVRHFGTGDVNINVAGTLLSRGVSFRPLFVRAGSNVEDVNVVVGTLRAYDQGMQIVHTGTGVTSVTVDNAYQTYSSTQDLIQITTDYNSAGVIFSGTTQIDGNVNIVTTQVVNTGGAGISAYSAGGSTSFEIRSLYIGEGPGIYSVTGSTMGIHVDNFGSGDVDLDVTDVTGQGSHGIDIEANGDSILNIRGDIVGAIDGIRTNNNGTGALDIDVIGAGSVYGSRTGIVSVGSTGGTVNVSGSVSGGTHHGVHITGASSHLNVRANSTITGARDGVRVDGGSGVIYAYAYAAVTGGNSGLNLVSSSNRIDIGVYDTMVTGTGQFGIRAESGSDQVNIFISGTSTISGGHTGIFAVSGYGSYIQIEADATVTTAGNNAIFVSDSGAYGPTDDRLNLSGTLDGHALLGTGNDLAVIHETAEITLGHDVQLGAGNDTARIFTAPAFAGDLLGGAGEFDTLELGEVVEFAPTPIGKFINPASMLAIGQVLDGSGRVSDNIRQFEYMDVYTNWTLDGLHFGYDGIAIKDGSYTTLAGTGQLNADGVIIESGATLELGDGSRIVSGDVSVFGDLNITASDDAGSADIVGVLTLTNGSVMNMSAHSVNDNDYLRLLGNGAGEGRGLLDGTLNLNQTYALTEGRYVLINATQNLTGTFDSVNGLGSGAGLVQSIEYNAATNKVRIFTDMVAMSPELAGGKSAASAANYIISGIGDTSAYAQLGFAVGVLPTTDAIAGFASEISPDVLDTATLMTSDAATRFSADMAGCEYNFSLNASETCADSEDGPAMFGQMRMSSANNGTEVGHNFNAQSFDMSVGAHLSDAGDDIQYGFMAGYSKGGSLSEAAFGESRDGLQAETFNLGLYATRDLGRVNLDGTATVSTSEAKMVRNIAPGMGLAEQATSEFTSRQLDLRARATLDTGTWIAPQATLGNRTSQRDGFTETGAALLGLTVDGDTRNVSYAGLGLQSDADFTDENGEGFTGLLRVTGLAYAGDTASDYTARFTGAPDQSRSFTTFGQDRDASLLLEGGFKYIGADGFSVAAEGFSDLNPVTGDASNVGAQLQLRKTF